MSTRTGRASAATLTAIAAALLMIVSLAPASQAAGSGFSHLNPGGAPKLTEKVPVNVVFLGYQPAQVDRDAYLAGLPSGYEPVVRSRLWYDQVEKLGLTYTYDYRVRYADKRYENRFFAELGRLATPAPLTIYQELYNEQRDAVTTITDNHHIDAASVERWLALNPPAGVDTRRNTTWYGDQVNSMMSYIDLNWDFSQFDRDNSDRFLTAAYNEAANRLAGEVLDSRHAGRARGELRAADRLLGAAQRSLSRHDYRQALILAEQAYDRVTEAARRAGVPTDSAAEAMATRAAQARSVVDLGGPHEFIDTLGPDGPRSQP
ncbi:hypothetical protein [Solwaraspora sp. WMMA2101]|uniref:hypothetical protein n=1 Tax=Solwaraspora sp. WMMA2101 TaxID=3404124 RepID=UPI003B93FE17